ncbi:MAG TPA: CoA-transferase [Pseudolysinimonas sp.]|nr:CoA-transferase [Pseudolysinimonas sp.]
MSRRSKLVSLSEAAGLVGDGDRLALGGFTIYNRPLAFARELVRQGRRGLTVVAMTAGPETELLAAGGCLSRLETSYVGLEKFGLAQRVRALSQSGELEIVDYSEVTSFDRFRADGDNQTFVPVDYLAGNSIVTPESGITPFTCPITGRPLFAVPAARPDVTVLHVPAADEFGNGLIPADRVMPQDLDIVMAQGSARLILTTERIVRTEDLADVAMTVQIPAFRTSAVVFAPWGAHPGPMSGNYETDEPAFAEFAEAGRDQATSAAHLERTVYGPRDHDDYLNEFGVTRLVGLLRRRL